MMCTLLTTGDGVPGRIAPTLAEIFGVPVPEVDVCDAWDLENRNWEASVTCEYMALDGDLSWSLAITAGDTPHISEEELALAVARSLGVDVIFPSDYPDISWIDRVATPAGEVGYVNTVEEEGEPPGGPLPSPRSPSPRSPMRKSGAFPRSSDLCNCRRLSPTPVSPVGAGGETPSGRC